MHRLLSRVFAAGAVGLMAAVLITLVPSNAVASSAMATPTGSEVPVVAEKSCATLYERLKPGETVSRVKARACGGSQAEARAELAALTCCLSYKLMTVYQHDNLEGLDDVMYGDFPCDPVGYGFSDLRPAHNNVGGITSYELHNLCGQSLLYNGHSFAQMCNGFRATSVGYVGTSCNDRIFSARIWQPV
jgi:uncharacterized protein with PIN domain